MKARAPPPPPQAPQPAPRQIFRNSAPGGAGLSGTDAKENILDLQLTLPGGYKTVVSEDGSKALMDLLVELCGRHHLNPALHTLELVSPEGRALAFKPNALLGSLDVASVHIKERASEEKVVRRPAPKVPEKTIRLMVNYHGSQKAVVRVNPSVPLGTLVPVICEKCDFDAAHVLLLRDSVSRRELPLDKSLAELDIKELYVHDRSLVLRPKMASAPVLYHSDSVRASTTSLSRAEKKGFLSLFQFGRKSRKHTTLDMDDSDHSVIQNANTHFDGLSTVSVVSSVDHQSSTLGHSQSVMNFPSTSPKTQNKKRRAPALPAAPTPSVAHAGLESYQMGSETQQRKRRAPVPPAANDLGAAAIETHAAETPEPPRHVVSVSAEVAPKSVKASPVRSRAEPPAPEHPGTPTSSFTSSSNSSSNSSSLAAHDSSSELSHSIDDSDQDQAQEGSQCSSSASSSVVIVAAAAVQRVAKTSSSSGSDGEAELNLRLDQVENRHSAVAWLHGGQAAQSKTPEDTASLASSSGSSSLPDQGYAPSEEMAEGEDSGTVSSPSDTQPTSPEGSLSPGLLGPVRDNSSDSDEGYAMSGSRRSHRDVSSKSKTREETSGYGEDPELTAQLHRTLADFEADLAEHVDTTSLKKNCHDVLSTGHSEVPVSVVDMDVPVTAIDDVFVEDSFTNTADHTPEIRGKSFVWSEVAETRVFSLQSSMSSTSSMEQQNKNNNVCIASDAKSSSVSSQTERRLRSQEDVSKWNQEGQRKLAATEISSSGATGEIKPRIKTPLWESTVRSMQEKKPAVSHGSQRALSAGRDDRVQQSTHSPYGAITHSATSRFGMKTFTVVPPRPSVSCDPTEPPSHGATVAAVKIDDQGNMVRAGIGHNEAGTSRAGSANGSPPFEKARDFWSSSDKQESHSRSPVEKDVRVRSPTAATVKVDVQSNVVQANIGCNSVRKPQEVSGDGLPPFGKARDFWSSSDKQQSHSAGIIERDVPVKTLSATAKAPPLRARPDIQTVKREEQETSVKFRVERNERLEEPKPLIFPEPRKDLAFLKPTRRTSSHYVASAINKSSNVSPRPSYAPRTSDSSIASLSSSQRPVHLPTVNPVPSSASLTGSNTKSSQPSLMPAHSAAPVRSLSHPEVSHSNGRPEAVEVRAIRGRFAGGFSSSGGITQLLESARHRQLQSSWVDRVSSSTAANGARDAVRLSPPLNPKPATSSTPPPPKVTPPGPTIASPKVQNYQNKMDAIRADVRVTADAKQEASVTVTDGGAVTPGALPTSLFGPVQKFRPVVCRSVEKETSLHSSLMEAIQSGRGRDGLKSTGPGPSSVKKVSYVEEENERSALLAAIRAQSNSSRLRKTQSEAATELQKFQTSCEGHAPFSPPPVFPPPPPPPPPQAPVLVLAPPPPLQPQGKPVVAAASSATDLALAREAMLEAIRSGAAAKRLKKVG